MEIKLVGDEVSDYLNFVVKDESTGNWYDLDGTNFQVGAALRALYGAAELCGRQAASTLGVGEPVGAGGCGLWLLCPATCHRLYCCACALMQLCRS